MRQSEIEQCHADAHREPNTGQCHGKGIQLLKLLVENKGTTLKKEYLFNRIWGSDSESELQTLTVHIKWLREKIEQDSRSRNTLITVWGSGIPI